MEKTRFIRIKPLDYLLESIRKVGDGLSAEPIKIDNFITHITEEEFKGKTGPGNIPDAHTVYVNLDDIPDSPFKEDFIGYRKRLDMRNYINKL